MILVVNFNLVENSMLQKVAEELGIGDRCRYLDTPISSRDELVGALDDPTGALPRVVIVNLDSRETEWSTLVKALKSHDVWKLVPIMGFGFLEDPDTVEQFYLLGGASCIQKPDGYEGLKAITDAAIQYWLDVSYMPSDFLTDAA
jgi:hypothetical protein